MFGTQVNFARNTMLYLLVLTVIITSYLPILFFNLNVPKPNLILITVFFCSIYMQNNAFHIFLIVAGLINDVLSSNILGISSLQFAIIAAFVRYNNKEITDQTFTVVWIGFGILYLACMAIQSAFDLLILGEMININIMLQVLITLLFYPSIHYLYSRVFLRL
jgi:rod shape-determining protein MreD